MDHYWISAAGKRFLFKIKALHFANASTEKCAGGRASSAAQPSLPSSSGNISTLGRSQLATKPTTVVEEALVPPSVDPKPAGGDFPPGWMQQLKPRTSATMNHYWISSARKRLNSIFLMIRNCCPLLDAVF
jgi:hypothetical protein